jgi:DNA mismatch endonuclease, patch repair protein
VDIFSQDFRSMIMASVRSKNTKPEMLIRSALHRLGYRYRLHVLDLPGCPDIVLPKYGAVIQVRGCFWHSHSCPRGRVPATRPEFWLPKLAGNKERDRRNDRALRKLGWRVITVWECLLASRAKVERQIARIVRLLAQV